MHGFLRVPACARSAGLCLTTVQTNGRSHQIVAPTAVARLVHRVRWFAAAPTSLHLTHRNLQAVDFALDPQRREQKLDYLLAPGREVRSWDRLEVVPGHVWRRLIKEWNGASGQASHPPSSCVATSLAVD